MIFIQDKKINSISKIKEDHEIKGDYIIAVGSFDSKKNYRILYEAYCILALEKFEKVTRTYNLWAAI